MLTKTLMVRSANYRFVPFSEKFEVHLYHVDGKFVMCVHGMVIFLCMANLYMCSWQLLCSVVHIIFIFIFFAWQVLFCVYGN